MNNSTGGSLTTIASSIQAGTYTINFAVTVDNATSKQLQLSHVYEESDGALNGVANPTEGDLIYGIVSNGSATMRKVAIDDKANFIAPVAVTASWQSAPTDPAEIASLNNQTFTATLTASGQAKLLATNAVTGLANQGSGSVTFTIVYTPAQNETPASWAFNVTTALDNAYVHVEPKHLDATETGTTGGLSVTAISGSIVAA